MRLYEERKYRKQLTAKSRSCFTVEHKKSDLWIAVDPSSWHESMPSFCIATITRLWNEMESYISHDPGYVTSLIPYPVRPDAPEILRLMGSASQKSGIGPMGAVAGAVAEYIGVALKEEFGCSEVIVENGGDIYARFTESLDISVFAGESPLSEKVGLHIPAEYSPLGICTSAGTVGPSLSFGRADAVMIVAHDTALADSYATAFANKVLKTEDIDLVIKDISARKDILGAVVIKDDKMGVSGIFDLKIFA